MKTQNEILGEELFKGYLTTAYKAAVVFFIWWAVIQLLYTLFYPLDPTDKDEWNRSNLVIRIDYNTGCQYLESPHGLTPRLNQLGQTMCGK
jgi:hypothetical protein